MASLFPVVPKKPDYRKRILPVCTEENETFFLKEAILTRPVKLGNNQMGISYPVIVGEAFDLLGISQARSLIAAGELPMTATIDNQIRLEYVYVEIEDQIFQFDVTTRPHASFAPNHNSDDREVLMNYSTTDFGLDKDSCDIKGKPFKHHKLLDIYGGIIYLNISLIGHIHPQTGKACVEVSRAFIKDVYAGHLTDSQSGVYSKMIREIVPEPSVVAVELDAYFTDF